MKDFKSFLWIYVWFLCSLYQKRILVINFPVKRFPNLFASYKHKILENPSPNPLWLLDYASPLFHRVSQHFSLQLFAYLHFLRGALMEWISRNWTHTRLPKSTYFPHSRALHGVLTAYFCWLWFFTAMQQM